MLNASSHGPLVSVIIPAYNAAGFIDETLNSVFNQTYSNYEVIVVNDGSPDTDELEKVLAPFRDRLIYIQQENKGPSAARNHAIKKLAVSLSRFWIVMTTGYQTTWRNRSS
jgi:glycosyltransferase involved in cell wall biosynthesis